MLDSDQIKLNFLQKLAFSYPPSYETYVTSFMSFTVNKGCINGRIKSETKTKGRKLSTCLWRMKRERRIQIVISNQLCKLQSVAIQTSQLNMVSSFGHIYFRKLLTYIVHVNWIEQITHSLVACQACSCMLSSVPSLACHFVLTHTYMAATITTPKSTTLTRCIELVADVPL